MGAATELLAYRSTKAASASACLPSLYLITSPSTCLRMDITAPCSPERPRSAAHLTRASPNQGCSLVEAPRPRAEALQHATSTLRRCTALACQQGVDGFEPHSSLRFAPHQSESRRTSTLLSSSTTLSPPTARPPRRGTAWHARAHQPFVALAREMERVSWGPLKRQQRRRRHLLPRPSAMLCLALPMASPNVMRHRAPHLTVVIDAEQPQARLLAP